MFNTVTKLAKEASDNAGKPAPETVSQRSSQSAPPTVTPTEDVAPGVVETDIEFPYYPGEGTSCGASCRCRWDVQVRWSPAHKSNATFATWVTAGDSEVCLDCQQRAVEWQDEMVRLGTGIAPGKLRDRDGLAFQQGGKLLAKQTHGTIPAPT